MTLTEFLLARIAEEEGRVRGTRIEQDDEGSWSPPERFVSDPFRLAEIEAKRRIVELHRFELDTLAALALPYAAHQDYREEWLTTR